MLSYETGLLVALFLWLWVTISAIVSINSQLNRNLHKIGQRLSWVTMTPEPMSAEEMNHGPLKKVLKFLLLYGAGLPFIFASWLYVACVVCLILYQRSKDLGAPQAVRDFRWKLKNMDMSFDQLVKELMKVSEQDPADFERVKADLIRHLHEQGLHAG